MTLPFASLNVAELLLCDGALFLGDVDMANSSSPSSTVEPSVFVRESRWEEWRLHEGEGGLSRVSEFRVGRLPGTDLASEAPVLFSRDRALSEEVELFWRRP